MAKSNMARRKSGRRTYGDWEIDVQKWPYGITAAGGIPLNVVLLGFVPSAMPVQPFNPATPSSLQPSVLHCTYDIDEILVMSNANATTGMTWTTGLFKGHYDTQAARFEVRGGSPADFSREDWLHLKADGGMSILSTTLATGPATVKRKLRGRITLGDGEALCYFAFVNSTQPLIGSLFPRYKIDREY